MRREPGERGALSPAVAILAVMIFALAGLVIDGARQLGARSRAMGYAQEAARAGAAAIDLNADKAIIDVHKAGGQVDMFCAAVRGNDPSVTACGTTELDDQHLVVQVELDNPATFLSMVGVHDLKAKGTGEAHAEQGIDKADETPDVPPLSVIPTQEGPGVTINPTAQPPTIDLPCPPLTISLPVPPTIGPWPMPASCTPSITPTPTESPTPTASPTPTPGPSKTPRR